ncbi:hypothetical protein PY370_02065 [Lactiplantibacillus plantarum]|nr:hypothetical protein [Lactiplantibacillus plantarum]WRM28745.1 hypothetical protein UHT29_02970 [Lactiplantibacillus plantarum]
MIKRMLNKFTKCLKKTWGKLIASATALTLIVTIITFVYDYNQQRNQVKTFKTAMIISCDASLYDADRLINKYQSLKKQDLPVSEFQYNVAELKENKATIEKLNTTRLPKTYVENYQLYLDNLSVMILQVENSMSVLKKDSGDFYNKKGLATQAQENVFHVTEDQADMAVENTMRLKLSLESFRKSIEHDKLAIDYKQYDNEFNKENSTLIEDKKQDVEEFNQQMK